MLRYSVMTSRSICVGMKCQRNLEMFGPMTTQSGRIWRFEKKYIVETTPLGHPALHPYEPPILVTSSSIQLVGLAPRPLSPSNGADAGSPSTPPASHWLSPAPASWGLGTPTTCSPTAQKGSRRKPRLSGWAPPDTPTHGNVRLGFVYERVPHITLKSIANNAEIDVIGERWQETLEPLRARAE